MKKLFLCLSFFFMMVTVSAHDIWDILYQKITVPEYIAEYNELKPVRQFEKFKYDCKQAAIGLTCDAYQLIYYQPKLTNVADGYATYIIPFQLKMART